MSLQGIRKAISYLDSELKTPHPLTDRRLKTGKVRLNGRSIGEIEEGVRFEARAA
ncbi:MAG: hypothetical protein ABI672_09075 [Vicinamibacteria bacterium]